MFLISKNGTKSLDVDVKSLGDPSIKVADLEDARREIISLSGIPAPYLGHMDVIELREQLVHINSTFATEISDLQEPITEGLNKLIDRISQIQDKKFTPSKYIQTGLIPPIVLILQLIEMTLSSVGNISGIFQQMNLDYDPYTFLKNYVSYLDWDEFQKDAEKYVGKTLAKNKLGSAEGDEGGGF